MPFRISGENGPFLQLHIVPLLGDAKSGTDALAGRAVEAVLPAPFREKTSMRGFDTDCHLPPPAGFSPLYHIEAGKQAISPFKVPKEGVPTFQELLRSPETPKLRHDSKWRIVAYFEIFRNATEVPPQRHLLYVFYTVLPIF